MNRPLNESALPIRRSGWNPDSGRPPPGQGVEGDCGDDVRDGEEEPRAAWCSYERVACIADRDAALDWQGASHLPQAHVNRVVHPSGREVAVTYDRQDDSPADAFNACTGEDRDAIDVCLSHFADTLRARPVEFRSDPRGRTFQRDDDELCWGIAHDRVERLTAEGAEVVTLTSDGLVDTTTRRGLPDDLALADAQREVVTRDVFERTGDEPGSVEVAPGVWRPRPFHERLQRTERAGVLQRTWRYDDLGRLRRTEAPEGAFVEYTNRDPAGRPRTILRPNAEVRVTYDDRFGLPLTREVWEGDQRLQASTTTYDALGRWTQHTTAGGARVDRSFLASDHDGQRVVETATPRAGQPHTRTRSFDKAGDLRHHTSGLEGHAVARLLDHAGRLRQVLDGGLLTRFHYDARGRLAERHLVADDHHLLYGYDDEARLSTVRAREGDGPETPVRQQTYDALDRVRTLIERGAHTWTRAYDVAGNLARTRAEDDDTTVERWLYDPRGRLREHTPPGGGPWGYTYDDADRLRTERRPDGAVTTYGYDDPRPWPTSRASDHLGFSEALEWDAIGRPRLRDRALQVGPDTLRQHATWAYPSAWQAVRTDADGGETRTTTRDTDGLGQLVREDRSGLVRDFTYDAHGNITRFGQPGLTRARASYDHLGRPLSLIDPAGVETTWTHAGLARTDVHHPDGTRSQTRRDALGRTTLLCEPGSASAAGAEACPDDARSATRLAYAGNRRTHTDPRGRQTVVDFDPAGRPARITTPGRGTTRISYSRGEEGLVVQIDDPVGRRTIDTTDGLGRAATHTVVGAPTGSFSVEWDGNDVTITRPGDDTVRQAYDTDGRLWQTTRGAQTTRLRYNGFGEISSVRDPAGLVTTIDYDRAGRPASILEPGLHLTSYGYRPDTNLLETLTRPDQLTETRLYDPAGRPAARILLRGPDLLRREHYGFDAAGRLGWSWASKSLDALPPLPAALCPDAATCFSYAQGRLASATGPGGRTTAWTYDAADQLQRLDVGPQSLVLTRDEAGRVATLKNGAHPPARFYYDAADRPTRTVDPADRVTESVWRPDDRLSIRRYGRLATPADDDADLEDVTEYAYRYDLRARADRITGPDGIVDLGWDTLDRPTTYVRDGELVSERLYDDAGRLDHITVAALRDPVTAELAYDDDGRLETLEVDGELRGRWTWNEAGLPTQARLDHTTACWRYHPDRSLASLAWYTGDDLDCDDLQAQDALHAWRQGPPDGRGRPRWLEQVADGRVRTDRLRYDDTDQLVAWHHLQAQDATFLDYDDTGRRTQLRVRPWTDAEAELPPEPPPGQLLEHTLYEADSAGHLEAVRDRTGGDDLPITTDPAGYLTGFGDPRFPTELPRDNRGRPADRTIDHQGFVHAHLRARTWRDLSGDLVSHSPEGGRVRHFLPALPGFQLVRDTHRQRWELALLRPDNSPVAVTDQHGAVLTSRLYAPFGQADERNAPRYTYPRSFVGYLPYSLPGAPTELLDAGHRLYAPAWGRFLGPDPEPVDPQDPRTADRFAYGFNDPIRFSDPDGRFPRADQRIDKLAMFLATPEGAEEWRANTARVVFYAGAVGQGAQGAVEVLAGVALLLTPEPTLATKVGGYAAILHGVDQYTAASASIQAGTSRRSLSSQGTERVALALGASARQAAGMGTVADIGPGLMLALPAVTHAAGAVHRATQGGVFGGVVDDAMAELQKGLAREMRGGRTGPAPTVIRSQGPAPKAVEPPPASGTYSELRKAGLKDGHHIVQDAAVRDLPGYSRSRAPAVQLDGPSTLRGSPHYRATQVQRQRGGGTYGAERRIAYKSMRKAGVSKEHARSLIEQADEFFRSLGVTPSTPTRIPGNRR